MINKSFETYKLKRELKRSGVEFQFRRNKKNEFGEDTEDIIEVGSILGLYHESNSNIQIVTGDTTRSRTKAIPMILCLYEDIDSIDIMVDDYILYNNKKMSVTGILDIQEWGLIADISLEVVDNVTQT